MEEIWKDIPKYEGLYQASNYGNIRSCDKKVWNYIKKSRILKPYLCTSGYYQLSLSNGQGGQKKYYVHRIIASTFLNKEKYQTEVNHKDLNKLNNKVENLEWTSRKENIRHFHLNADTKQIFIERSKNSRIKMNNKKNAAKETVKYLYYVENYTIKKISGIITLGRDRISEIIRDIQIEEGILLNGQMGNTPSYHQSEKR